MNDRHRAACTSGSELLAENTPLAGRCGGVIKAAGIDRNLVPIAERRFGIEGRRTGSTSRRDARVRDWIETRSQRVAKAPGKTVSRRWWSGAEKKRQNDNSHPWNTHRNLYDNGIAIVRRWIAAEKNKNCTL